MTDGARQRSSTAGSAKDAAAEKESGGGVALKKEIGLVSACGIIVGKCRTVMTPIWNKPATGVKKITWHNLQQLSQHSATTERVASMFESGEI